MSASNGAGAGAGGSKGQPLSRTVVGLVAIVLWSTLASLTAVTGSLPTFQLLAMGFGIGALVGVLLSLRGGRRAGAGLPAAAGSVAAGHLWFVRLSPLLLCGAAHAPAVEANLLNYLWPLLIVLFSALTLGQRLRWPQIAGALLGFAGAALLVTVARSCAGS